MKTGDQYFAAGEGEKPLRHLWNFRVLMRNIEDVGTVGKLWRRVRSLDADKATCLTLGIARPTTVIEHPLDADCRGWIRAGILVGQRSHDCTDLVFACVRF